MAKKRKRVAWSAEQIRTLKSMAKKKTPAPRIAKKLKRTEGATRQKAFSMGLSLEFARIGFAALRRSYGPPATFTGERGFCLGAGPHPLRFTSALAIRLSEHNEIVKVAVS